MTKKETVMKTSCKENIHKGHRGRLRDSVLKNGIESFYDYQVLEYLLTFVLPQKDTNPLAHVLINHFGSFSNVLDASFEDLKTVKGVGEICATFLTTLPQIFNLYKKDRLKHTEKITNVREILEYFHPIFKGKITEEVYVLCLDKDGFWLSCKMFARGNKNCAELKIKDIVEYGIRNKCENMVIAHNHTSAEPKPSAADFRFTRAVCVSLKLSGMTLVDHIIICENKKYFSFMMEKQLISFENEANSISFCVDKVAQNIDEGKNEF